MIAQRRKACAESKGRDLAVGAGKKIKSPENARQGSDKLREPCGWLAESRISPLPKDIDAREAAASEPLRLDVVFGARTGVNATAVMGYLSGVGTNRTSSPRVTRWARPVEKSNSKPSTRGGMWRANMTRAR